MVPGESVLAVLAVASGRVVATLLAHTATLPARLLKHLHAEATLVGVAVALAGCTREKEEDDRQSEEDNSRIIIYDTLV